MMSPLRNDLLCPSAQPDMNEARVMGVVGGTPEAPEIAYLGPGAEIDPSLTNQLKELHPTQVFRFAAQCEPSRCAHFEEGRCSLANRIVQYLPEVVDVLPPCQIRHGCRWYAEEGAPACRRCPQVITMIPKRADALNHAATPPRGLTPSHTGSTSFS
ncbi:MAG: nitrogen fixation protein [Nitrospira sp.]|jgi:hypothetical protein|nr:nitrogen fixation protein [Nitrospira sp.]MCE3222510.1 nitrogen fixation protein [Nitrospira sp.]